MSAVQKLATSNPPTISVHNKIISALITSRNSPKVMIVTGKVNNTKMGLMKILSNASTMATITEVVKLATVTPGIKCAMMRTSSAVTKILMIRFMMLFFNSPKVKNFLIAGKFTV